MDLAPVQKMYVHTLTTLQIIPVFVGKINPKIDKNIKKQTALSGAVCSVSKQNYFLRVSGGLFFVKFIYFLG